jgi:hypothetical protein
MIIFRLPISVRHVHILLLGHFIASIEETLVRIWIHQSQSFKRIDREAKSSTNVGEGWGAPEDPSEHVRG